MSKVTVDLSTPTPYAETDSRLHQFKRRLTYRNILSRVRPALRNEPECRVLEVGCGSGYLLSRLEELVPRAELWGLEYDPRLVSLTCSKLKRAKVIQGNAESFALPGQFDLVVSCQVIEHLYNPIGMIKSAHEQLKSGGLFAFTTPNLTSVAARFMGSKWHGFRPDHVSLKSMAEWGALARAFPFVSVYEGSTFFSGIPLLNRFPLGVFNWTFLLTLGSLRWHHGESYVGVFRKVG